MDIRASDTRCPPEEPPRPPPGMGSRARIQPGKLLHSKWTAVQPRDREKHWLVTRILDPEQPAHRWEWIVIEAVHSRRSRTIRWRDLQDSSVWRQGWN